MLRNTISGLERFDIHSHAVLDGIVDDAKLRGEFWLPDEAYFEVIHRAVQLSPIAALGLGIGKRGGDWAGFGAPGLYVSQARSFTDAMQALVRFGRATRDQPDVFLVQDEHRLSVQFGPYAAPLPVCEFLAEIALAAMWELFQRFAGPRASPLEVLLDYPAPQHAEEYFKVFACPVRFDQPRASLVVPRALADREQLLFQPELSEQLGRLAERSIAGGDTALCIAERVRACMRRGWNADNTSMSTIAGELGVSERSLRRHLAREGVCFRSLLAESRLEVAREMLRDGIVVKQVAGELGYRSTSAFHRAFRRWAGSTPIAFAVGERDADLAANVRTNAIPAMNGWGLDQLG